MAGESVSKVDPQLSNGLTEVNHWLSGNSDILIQYGINIISAILILFIGNLIVKVIAGSISKVLQKKKMDQAVVEFINGMVRYLLFVIVLIAALGRLGVQTASVVAVIGAAGLAVGLPLWYADVDQVPPYFIAGATAVAGSIYFAFKGQNKDRENAIRQIRFTRLSEQELEKQVEDEKKKLDDLEKEKQKIQEQLKDKEQESK